MSLSFAVKNSILYSTSTTPKMRTKNILNFGWIMYYTFSLEVLKMAGNGFCKTESMFNFNSVPISKLQWSTPFLRIRRTAHWIVNMKYFDFIIMAVISMSSIALAAEDPVDENASQNFFLNKLDHAFTVVFTMEMVGHGYFFFFRLVTQEHSPFDFALYFWRQDGCMTLKVLFGFYISHHMGYIYFLFGCSEIVVWHF